MRTISVSPYEDEMPCVSRRLRAAVEGSRNRAKSVGGVRVYGKARYADVSASGGSGSARRDFGS